jgi:hypothetical protein
MKKLLLIIVFINLNTIMSGSSDIKNAIQWGRWEARLVTDGIASVPSEVKIEFTCPGKKSLIAHAFTDDMKNYTFRCSFPSPGVWKWKSSSSDAALNNKTGKVNVDPYKGSNPLFKHGDLGVSENKRYLVHYDGTPFLWMGETGWNATLRGTIKEWRDYVDKRASQGFSVIQISPRGSGNRNTASAGAEISFKPDGTTDPEWWKDLEEKIAYANDKGLYIFMVGIGSAWRDQTAKNTANQKFESYITGRFASFMVGFSPSFDQLYRDELDTVQRELQKLTTKLISQHPGTNYEANVRYRNSDVDFAGEQSGHHAGNLLKVYNAARQWTLDLWNSLPVKPVIDIEGMYDAYGNDTGGRSWREKDVRKCGWIAWLSGSRGYTYGCGDIPPKVPRGKGGVWLFNKDSLSYDYWRNAVNWPSAGQMTVMRDFFSSIEWWKLVPVHELIVSQQENDTLKIVVSKSPDSSLIVAYLPYNGSVILNMEGLTGNYGCIWIDPKTGNNKVSGRIAGGNSFCEFTKPEGWEDAVLKLQRTQ